MLSKIIMTENTGISAPKKDKLAWLKSLLPKKSNDDELREALEEYIEELSDSDPTEQSSPQERLLISNMLKLRDRAVKDVMIPRIDIVAIDLTTTPEDLMQLLSEKQFSRIPVYRDNLDDILGTIHIKDVLAILAKKQNLILKDLIREAPIVAPSLPVVDLLLLMKEQRKHLAFVVDEYGGIDGLVTIGDVLESITGEIQDEHEHHDEPTLITKEDGIVLADARLSLEDFEKKFGSALEEEERAVIDTIGGLIFHVAGRVPARGEIIKFERLNLVFEILEADPRRVHRIKISPNKRSSSQQNAAE
jgi:CBS domain containing-hemolysin-like protein